MGLVTQVVFTNTLLRKFKIIDLNFYAKISKL